MTRDVAFEPVEGAINERIDGAYRSKYHTSPYLDAMIGERARLATEKSRRAQGARSKERDMEIRQLLVLGATVLAIGCAPAFAQDSKEPYVRVAEIEIDLARLDAYKAALKKQIEAALRLEPGVLALYAVTDKENPARVLVFEMYADVEAYRAHLETDHFKEYKVTTQDLVKSLKLRDTVPIQLGAKPR